ncbi:FAD/NAD(P)-binding oxidoreductase [Streptomyces sp. ITFR-16]|uniref:NAD(P)/FAD-dependent oxidoreductase n=1 Tax=Streptomyces sp. ITFR-16 TaxID=3075198 RepID=UPI00288C2C51|nr:FAD/NAD(P)-binding oxidoreductase [Streptomyces sp. ITFR-16]WNI21418.1 FAD/NAD(P)-binding oxidoreductase [Streptomyces sp. ITFR-16]
MSNILPRTVVVVGASAAGLTAAESLRRQGYADRLVLVGEETHLPYDRPPLSKQLLSGEWETDRLSLRTPEAVAELGLDLRLGSRAVSLDTHAHEVTLDDGSPVRYDALVVATGTRARRLPGAEGLANVHVLRTLEDAVALRADLAALPHLVVVGGGFVGAEAAAVARRLGCEVTLVTDTAQPMGDALGDELGAMLRAVHAENGVNVITGSRVERLRTESGRATGVQLVDGSVIDAQSVLVGIGARPNTEWLVGSGLTVTDGVVCDAMLQAAPGVWAAGDVAAWPHPLTGQPARIEHRTNAGEQGLAVARSILLGPDRATTFESVPYVWSDQYDLKIQVYGRTREADEVHVVEGSTDERRLIALYGRAGRVCAAVGVNMVRSLRGYRPQVAEGAALTLGSVA